MAFEEVVTLLKLDLPDIRGQTRVKVNGLHPVLKYNTHSCEINEAGRGGRGGACRGAWAAGMFCHRRLGRIQRMVVALTSPSPSSSSSNCCPIRCETKRDPETPLG